MSAFISLRHELVTLMDEGLNAVEIAAVLNIPVWKAKEMIEEENTWMQPLDDSDCCF